MAKKAPVKKKKAPVKKKSKAQAKPKTRVVYRTRTVRENNPFGDVNKMVVSGMGMTMGLGMMGMMGATMSNMMPKKQQAAPAPAPAAGANIGAVKNNDEFIAAAIPVK